MPHTETLGKYRRAIAAIGEQQDQVVSRRQIASVAPRWFLRNELRRRRWQPAGKQTVVLHNGPIPTGSARWAAVLETGSAAVLDGVTALQAAGIAGLSDTIIHVATPRGSTPRKPKGVKVHETRRLRPEDVLRSGLPRVTPATAAVHAALWARTDREAQLFLTMTVQQGLATAEQLEAAVALVKRHKRRQLLKRSLLDLGGGVHSLNELDIANALRRRGLPEPVRQSVKRRLSGTIYLDNEFPEYRLVLEVDGRGHDAAEARLSDLVRDLRQLAAGANTVRIPMVAWRLDEEAVLDALEEVFRARGWRRPAGLSTTVASA